MALQARAGCASIAGDDALALRLMRESAALVDDGFPGVLGIYLSVNLGLQQYANGDREGARRVFLDALGHASRFATRRIVAACLEIGAYLEADRAGYERAARMIGAAARLREVTGSPLFPHWQRLHASAEARIGSALGGDAFARERESGSKLPFHTLMALAREVLSTGAGSSG